VTPSSWVRLIGALLLVFALAACERLQETSEYQEMGNVAHILPGFHGTPGLEIHAVRSSKTVIVHKIAVMPLIEEPDKIEHNLAPGATESATAEVYARATILGGWTVVTQEDVANILQQMPPTTAADMDQNALELGRKLGADGVLYGSVHHYKERVGYDYAAQSPASVAFTLKFVDEKSQQIVWTANFAKEQKSLSDNVFDLPTFIANNGRWVRANDLTAQGAQAALENLQDKITVQPIVQGQY